MDKDVVSSRIVELSELIQYHSELYYNRNSANSAKPEITDAEYDAMVDELRSLVAALEKISPDAEEVFLGKEVLNNVGATPSYGRKVAHSHIMGSLEKATTIEEVKAWYAKYAPAGGCKIVVTPKVDGCASRVNFDIGLFKEAATRGDGTIGQDVTDNVRQIKSIPKSLPSDLTAEVRGEIIMFRKTFQDFLDNGGTGANPRNVGTGSLMQQDPNVTGSRNLNFFAYDVLGTVRTFQRESDKLEWMKACLTGFDVVPYHLIDINQFEQIATAWEGNRPTLDYEIDGLVIALDSIEAQEDAGWNGKRPNGKIAFKFKPEQKTAIVENIDWQVGRTGRLTPMARIEPTLLAGSTISNITLHNLSRVKELDIAIGDEVLIEKAGDIIPQVVRVTKRPGSRMRNVVATICPSCGEEVHPDEEGVNMWCDNVACPAQLSRRVLHWIKTLGVMGVGPGIVDELCSRGFVKDIPDLYFLTEDQLIAATGGRNAAQKVQTALLEKSEIPLAVFLDGLGIDGLGTTTSKEVAKTFKTLDEVCKRQVVEFSVIPGIGVITGENIFNGLKKLAPMIECLKTTVDIQEVKEINGTLSGMSFVLTGTMNKPRKVIEEAIEKAGGENKGSVGKGVTYLVQADPSSTSSKTEKAKKCGTKIISEETLWGMIDGSITAP